MGRPAHAIELFTKSRYDSLLSANLVGAAIPSLFTRAKTPNGVNDFKARNAGRDADTDRTRVAAIAQALDAALASAEAEQTGLSGRIEDVLARASSALGNDGDEYLSREDADSRQLRSFEAEMANGERRLKELATQVTHLRFLKAALLSRFPDFKPG